MNYIPFKTKPVKRLQCIALAILLVLAINYHVFFDFYNYHAAPRMEIDIFPSTCPQVESQTPHMSANLYVTLEKLYNTEDFMNRVANWLSGAVQVPTEFHDSAGPTDGVPGWKVFDRFHDYLLSTYPLIHDTLELTKVNTYGLVYHWQGTDRTLDPLLLTGHQDVVLVDPVTIDQWIHPPYSGYYDGTYIWGRGSSDDKGGLISLMSTVETLLAHAFQPQRTVVLAFGFDEETGGHFGAQEISNYLLQRYGENGFAFLIDEGGNTINAYGAKIIAPSTAEKGLLNIGVQVSTPGGHSSRPPDHTSIGILSGFLVALEENPPKPHLSRDQVTYDTIRCFVHAPDISESLVQDIILSEKSDEALRRVEKQILSAHPEMEYIMGTTQAVDVIQGGIKANILPEEATAIINYRVDTTSSSDVVERQVSAVLKPVIEKYGVGATLFGETISTSFLGSVAVYNTSSKPLEPSPRTSSQSEAWSLLSASIRALVEESGIEEKIVVAPGIMTGNTDTRHYWKLTPHIFRYSPRIRQNNTYPGGGVHSVNEAMSVIGLVDFVRFFTILILNADESRGV